MLPFLTHLLLLLDIHIILVVLDDRSSLSFLSCVCACVVLQWSRTEGSGGNPHFPTAQIYGLFRDFILSGLRPLDIFRNHEFIGRRINTEVCPALSSIVRRAGELQTTLVTLSLCATTLSDVFRRQRLQGLHNLRRSCWSSSRSPVYNGVHVPTRQRAEM